MLLWRIYQNWLYVHITTILFIHLPQVSWTFFRLSRWWVYQKFICLIVISNMLSFLSKFWIVLLKYALFYCIFTGEIVFVFELLIEDIPSFVFRKVLHGFKIVCSNWTTLIIYNLLLNTNIHRAIKRCLTIYLRWILNIRQTIFYVTAEATLILMINCVRFLEHGEKFQLDLAIWCVRSLMDGDVIWLVVVISDWCLIYWTHYVGLISHV